MLNLLRTALRGLLELLYPNLCLWCRKSLIQGETHLCLRCFMHLPQTNFYHHPENAIEQRLRGRVRIQAAASVYFFSKTSAIQTVLHALKYRNNKALGVYLGRCMAHAAEGSTWQEGIDWIIPVPLSKRKLAERGYNQSDCLAQGLSEVWQIPWSNQYLIRERHTATQTKKSRTERRKNVSGAFALRNEQALQHRCVLLVDDVFTTGATLEACLETLQTIPGIQLRVLTLACAIE